MMLSFLLSRLKEPSSYAGLGALLAAAGMHPDSAALGGFVNAAVAISGLAAVLMPEKGAPKQ